jgi:hypothetical protein
LSVPHSQVIRIYRCLEGRDRARSLRGDSSDHNRARSRSDALTRARSIAVEQLAGRPFLPGHQYQHVQVNEGAKAHLGDTYHISQSPADAKEERHETDTLIGRENQLSLLPFATNALSIRMTASTNPPAFPTSQRVSFSDT